MAKIKEKDMTARPELDAKLSGDEFRNYYYLKEELTDFCRKNGLPVSGGKPELTERIATFLDTGKVTNVSTRKIRTVLDGEITESSIIEQGITFSEKHRKFFKERIGKGFSFNIPFQTWLKSNAGKTYGEAVAAYYILVEEKKKVKQPIGKQFEYNTYIRDFFADDGNKGKSLNDAITCWKYKKSLSGSNRYEPSDLVTLK